LNWEKQPRLPIAVRASPDDLILGHFVESFLRIVISQRPNYPGRTSKLRQNWYLISWQEERRREIAAIMVKQRSH